jgi:hypothetical protein
MTIPAAHDDSLHAAYARETGTSARPPLLAFCAQRWGFDWQRPQQLLTRLAKHYRVFYVEEPVTTHQDAYLECTVVANGVTVLVPHTRCDVAGLHDAQLPIVHALLATFMRERGLAEPLAWFDTPAALPLLAGLQARGILYDCHLDPALLREAAAHHDLAALCAADVVVAGGPSLYEQLRGHHANVHCIANAVDAEHFAPPAPAGSAIEAVSARAIHAELRSPRLGYFGVVDERVDLALVARVADLRPDWQIVMAGPLLRVDPQALPRRANIHWLGAQTYAILPHLQAHWDVCILPFDCAATARHAAPIETLEYLGGHKSVVSTPVHDVVALHGHIVRVACTADDFVDACRAAMCERGPLRRQRGIDALIAVHSCTWDRAAARVHKLLVEFARTPAPLPDPSLRQAMAGVMAMRRRATAALLVPG